MIDPSFHRCFQEQINHNPGANKGKESIRVIHDTIRHIREYLAPDQTLSFFTEPDHL